MQNRPICITGPFRKLLTMDHLPLKGSLKDAQLEIIEEAGIVHQAGKILEIGLFKELCANYNHLSPEIQHTESDMIALPGFVDAHTHLCWAGSRENDYAMRLEGRSYTEIAQSGGGIWDTVTKTRNATDEELKKLLKMRADRQLANGITTCEVKSGYALSPEGELRLLEIIRSANQEHSIDLVPTCLAAHIKPKDFDGGTEAYLQFLTDKLLPVIKKEKLTSRVDIFVEDGAFGVQEAGKYLFEAKKMGFDLVVHGEQFTSGGAALAVRIGAKSVDHLEMIGAEAIAELAASEVVAMALPGASI
ncbi:MAG: imidazolonepropionase, partial [Bacteroidota bacterium]